MAGWGNIKVINFYSRKNPTLLLSRRFTDHYENIRFRSGPIGRPQGPDWPSHRKGPFPQAFRIWIRIRHHDGKPRLSEIIGNPNAVHQQLRASSNLATNYFAVAHPSLTNYLEIVGGSNFGDPQRQPPRLAQWQLRDPTSPRASSNTDNPPARHLPDLGNRHGRRETPAIDCTNEVTGPPAKSTSTARRRYPAVPPHLGKTIADQLVAAGKTWKTYQENLPPTGADGVNYSDGNFTNNTDFTKIKPHPESGPATR